MRLPALALCALLGAGCGAGSRRTVEVQDVSPALAGSSAPFAELRLTWVETGLERYDRFFREAAALQGALVLAERAEACAGEPAPIVPVLAEVGIRAAAAHEVGRALLESAVADFAHDEKMAMAIGPALHEALGQIRDAAARAPPLLERLRASCAGDAVAPPSIPGAAPR